MIRRAGRQPQKPKSGAVDRETVSPKISLVVRGNHPTTGILRARQLLAGTAYAILIMFVRGALLTPPDFVSHFFLAVPMVLLYPKGVAVAFSFEPDRRAAREAKKAGSGVTKTD